MISRVSGLHFSTSLRDGRFRLTACMGCRLCQN